MSKKLPNCIYSECKIKLYVKGFVPWVDIKCPNCGRAFNLLFGDGEFIGYIKKDGATKEEIIV